MLHSIFMRNSWPLERPSLANCQQAAAYIHKYLSSEDLQHTTASELAGIRPYARPAAPRFHNSGHKHLSAGDKWHQNK